jgi:hypothetical protein
MLSPLGVARMWGRYGNLTKADGYLGRNTIFIWRPQGGDVHILGQGIDTALCADLSAEAVSTVETRKEPWGLTYSEGRSGEQDCKAPLIGDVWRFQSNLLVRTLNTPVFSYKPGKYTETLRKRRVIDGNLARCGV